MHRLLIARFFLRYLLEEALPDLPDRSVRKTVGDFSTGDEQLETVGGFRSRRCAAPAGEISAG
jgi:hypothetical protein